MLLWRVIHGNQEDSLIRRLNGTILESQGASYPDQNCTLEYFIVLLYFQKYKTRNVNPEAMYFCFRVLYFQKYKKTKTLSMLSAPGLYFLYFFRYLGCVGRIISRLHCSLFMLCHHTAAIPKNLYTMLVETKLVCCKGTMHLSHCCC